MDTNFSVCDYNTDNFRSLLKSRNTEGIELIDDYDLNGKPIVSYLEYYLNTLQAKSIIVERDYIDHDYMMDFAEYHARCFYDYSRKCVRLHFFHERVNPRAFNLFLSGRKRSIGKLLQDTYLGFIVVKPLPYTIIGRTCLQTYPIDDKPRKFPITRNYAAHVCGLELTVNTLAFQEQDHVLAACSTSALWSAFQGTGRLFHHAIPSPIEITKMANASEATNRPFPSRGLSISQMVHAVRSVSMAMDPYVEKIEDEFILKSTLYAYLRGHVPVVMMVRYPDKEKNQLSEDGHTVVVTGYNLGAEIKPYETDGGDFTLMTTGIDKLYAHDDQVGPFSRMVFSSNKLQVESKDGSKGETKELITLDIGIIEHGIHKTRKVVPTAIIVPLYHKIRISYKVISDIIINFDQFIKYLTRREQLELTTPIWDIYLTSGVQFKADILKSRDLKGKYRRELLTQNLPRFIWRATLYDDTKVILDLLFDATDIEFGVLFIRAIEYNEYVSSVLRAIIPPIVASHFEPPVESGAESEIEEDELEAEEDTSSIFQRPDRRVFEWFTKDNSPFKQSRRPKKRNQ